MSEKKTAKRRNYLSDPAEKHLRSVAPTEYETNIYGSRKVI